MKRSLLKAFTSLHGCGDLLLHAHELSLQLGRQSKQFGNDRVCPCRFLDSFVVFLHVGADGERPTRRMSQLPLLQTRNCCSCAQREIMFENSGNNPDENRYNLSGDLFLGPYYQPKCGNVRRSPHFLSQVVVIAALAPDTFLGQETTMGTFHGALYSLNGTWQLAVQGTTSIEYIPVSLHRD